MVLENFGTSLDILIRKIRRLPKVDKNAIDGILKELQRALLMADVNVEICLTITEKIKKQATDTKINSRVDRQDFIIKLLHDELIAVLGGKEAPKRIKTGKQSIILMIGIQGSGKTTTVGKLAKYYQKRGYRIGVICTDTWRPGAYDQLAQTLDPLGIDHFGMPEEKNALKIAKKGLKHYQKVKGKDQKDLLIVDTAGRHSQEADLMAEMQKLENIIKPNETILVIDGTLGQQAFSQAQAFAKTTHVGSIIVTKLDGSAKGGGALSAAAAAGAPIKFIGVGERVDDLEPFVPTAFIGSLMGVPDLEGLMKKIEELGIEPDDDQIDRLKKGRFTLEDMYQQFIALRKMGGFSKVLSMLGGQNLPKEAKEMAEGNLDRVQVIIQSCTQEEKDDPNMIKKTRITRIAKGSGTTYTEVKGLLKQWSAMNTMMKGMLGKKRRGKRGQQMPGMPGMDGELPKGMDLQQAQQMMAGAQKKKRKKHPW